MKRFAFATLATLGFMVVFLGHVKFYDLATGAFFTWGLVLLGRGKLTAFLALFPAACANRETTILLTVLFCLYFFGRLAFWQWLAGMIWQGVTFTAVRFWIMRMYAGNYGVDFMFRPLENFAEFAGAPLLTLIHWAVFAWIGWRIVRGWRLWHPFWQYAALVLFPALMAMYLVLGWSFEVRVFAEGYGLAAVMGFLGDVEHAFQPLDKRA